MCKNLRMCSEAVELLASDCSHAILTLFGGAHNAKATLPEADNSGSRG